MTCCKCSPKPEEEEPNSKSQNEEDSGKEPEEKNSHKVKWSGAVSRASETEPPRTRPTRDQPNESVTSGRIQA